MVLQPGRQAEPLALAALIFWIQEGAQPWMEAPKLHLGSALQVKALRTFLALDSPLPVQLAS